MHALVDEVADCDHSKREGAEEIVGAGRKERRINVPDEKCEDARERNDAEYGGNGPVGAVETSVHRTSIAAGCAAYV